MHVIFIICKDGLSALRASCILLLSKRINLKVLSGSLAFPGERGRLNVEMIIYLILFFIYYKTHCTFKYYQCFVGGRRHGVVPELLANKGEEFTAYYHC